MSIDLRAIAERATGRTVTAFLSSTSLGPSFCVETFKLPPFQAR